MITIIRQHLELLGSLQFKIYLLHVFKKQLVGTYILSYHYNVSITNEYLLFSLINGNTAKKVPFIFDHSPTFVGDHYYVWIPSKYKREENVSRMYPFINEYGEIIFRCLEHVAFTW